MHIHRHRGDGGRQGKEVIWSENDLGKHDAIPEVARGQLDSNGKLNKIKEIVEDIRTGVQANRQPPPAADLEEAVENNEGELHAEPGGVRRLV